jgi:DNA-nicking Smr family endonuclease
MAKPPRSSPPDAPPETDEGLWERVTETTEPLRRGRNRARLRDTQAPKGDAPPRKPVPAAKAKTPAPKPAPEVLPAPPPLGNFDRREMRGLGAGRVDIDARIDLHGMRQREAHQALKGFLVRARSSGHRHVLVITGKGSQRASDDGESFHEAQTRQKGVLREAVPRWLNEPGFREMAVSFTTASPRHGGEGALYVRLRKAGKA